MKKKCIIAQNYFSNLKIYPNLNITLDLAPKPLNVLEARTIKFKTFTNT